jgi:hypothetical protein
MVKKLYAYLGKTIYVSYGDGGPRFRSQLIRKIDEQGNNKYYLRTPEGKKRIYSKGKKRVSMYNGVLLVLDQDRKWSDVINFMNEKDKEIPLKP